MAMSIQKKRLIAAAERRAKCMAWFKNIEEPHSVAEVAAQFGWTGEEARQTLMSLADAKLISAVGKGLGRGHKVTYGPLEGPAKLARPLVPAAPESSPVAPVQALPVASKRNGKTNGHEAAPTVGLELVIGGVRAIIDRNPQTGRPRVQFDL